MRQNFFSRNSFWVLLITGCFLTFCLGLLTWEASGEVLSQSGLAAATRVIIGLFTGTITAMALIITLTANLYTPYILHLFMRDKFILTGTSAIIFSMLIILLSVFVDPASHYYDYFSLFGFIFSCLTLATIAPYLYYTSQFLKPDFFLPKLEDRTRDFLMDLIENRYTPFERREAFHTIDVIANICNTASKRDDKELMTLSLKVLHEIFEFMLNNHRDDNNSWRVDTPVFVPGLSQEGEFYLEKNNIWPEAFILSKILRILNSLDHSKNDIIPYVCDDLLSSLDIVNTANRAKLVELHLMVYNSLFRKSLEQKNLERFQSVSYYYRLAIEILNGCDDHLKFATKSFLHYGDVSLRKGMGVGKETVLFDMSRIVLYMAYESESMALRYFKEYLYEDLRKDLAKDDQVRKVAMRSIVKTYWESRAKKCDQLADFIKESYLINEHEHQSALRYLLSYDREMHWELNDRLLNFAHLSDRALIKAKEYLQEKGQAA